ncbi:hypothetical protein FPV67DRAFT_1663905 [Lyophyllum atratum]|nr:hypothetical protein FPV67DRAFT_1663905 [Lyophyllum atratum]
MVTDQKEEDEGTQRREEEAKGGVQKASTSADVPKLEVLPSSRPLTRSQTGRVPKRRRPHDSPSPEPRKRVTRVSKKHMAAPYVASDSSEADAPKGRRPPPEVSTPLLEGDTPPLNATQLAHLNSSSYNQNAHNQNTAMDLAVPKTRATLPVPVPNLTKKSRGRRVPTRLPNDDSNVDAKDTRMYICKVESCGKCFHRGEHLKRHIRSIHTHEKPFKCTYPLCNKNFNRHDNLLQHIKVHKDLATSESSNTDDAGSPVQLRQSTPPPLLSVAPPRQLQPYYPPHEPYDTSMKQARTATIYQPPTSSFHTYSAPYASLSEPLSFAASMAVSSLRTEIPQSPPALRTQVDQTA